MSPANDIATIVGGNRYGWFTYNNINGLAIVNTLLASASVPAPATARMLGAGLLLAGAAARRNARRAS